MIEKIELSKIIDIAKDAGVAIMDVYKKDFEVEFKGDESPLTEADKKAHLIIEKGLNELSQNIGENIPVLSEEGKNIEFSERKKLGLLLVG